MGSTPGFPLYKLNGLSVKIIGRTKGSNPGLRIQVRYDDVDVVQDTRWTGDLLMTDVVAGTGADVHVAGATLTLDKSGTANRHTLTAAHDFINPTHFLCAAGTTFRVDAASRAGLVHITGEKTTFQVAGTVSVGDSSQIKADDTSLLELLDGSTFAISGSGKVVVQDGATLLIRRGATVTGAGHIEVQPGGYICVEDGAHFQTDPNFVIGIDPYGSVGVSAQLGLSSPSCGRYICFDGAIYGGYPGLQKQCFTESLVASRQRVAHYAVVPNPAIDQAQVSLQLDRAAEVSFSVQDMQGVTRLPAQTYHLTAGAHTLPLSVRTLPLGVYLLVMQTPGGRQVTRLQVDH